jgi:DNA-directed RNA polymerase subunit M/transcription elongation factor TFIIS
MGLLWCFRCGWGLASEAKIDRIVIVCPKCGHRNRFSAKYCEEEKIKPQSVDGTRIANTAP